VTFDVLPSDSVYNIEVKVTERWYIWPIPIVNTAGRNINAWWESRDWGRLNYGVDLRVENFRGRMERLNVIVQGGFDQKVEARWTIPYLTKRQFLGIGIGGGMQWNREVIYATVEDKPQFYEAGSGFARELIFGVFQITMRPKFNFLHTISLEYNYNQFQDSLLKLNPEYAGSQTVQDFFILGYLYKHDFRDYLPYPLKGYYFDIGLAKNGLGMNSDYVDFWSFSFTADHYINIYKRWYFAYSFAGWFANKNQLPYYLTPAFGLEGLEIRGYELYLVNGQQLGLFKSNFKFEIIPRTTKRINWIKTEKFGKIFYALYANLFFDAGYASDQQFDEYNNLTNQLLWGTGLGIDFITYYDLVFRFEYTINKQGDHGFFINLVAPI
jgi:outer membrane protein assembly factor BamA